jgi:thiol-disulfide isomerase/thioredoxin
MIWLLSLAAQAQCPLLEEKTSSEIVDVRMEDIPSLAAQAKGCTAVFELWATWCGPCLKVEPELEELERKHPGTVFIRISVDENRGRLEVHLSKKPPSSTPRHMRGWSLAGLEKEFAAMGASFPAEIPYFLLLDRDGKPVLELAEPKNLSKLDRALTEAAAKP